MKFLSGDLASLRQVLGEWKPRRVIATGGGASRLVRELRDLGGSHGARVRGLARAGPAAGGAGSGSSCPRSISSPSSASGTSVLAIEPGGARRIGGSALGGGTLLGLGRLLLGVDTFDEICALASRGDRRRVDLSVGDIYPGGEIALPPDLNASSFAKLESREPPDLAHALVGMLGENIGLICGNLARGIGASAILYLAARPCCTTASCRRSCAGSPRCTARRRTLPEHGVLWRARRRCGDRRRRERIRANARRVAAPLDAVHAIAQDLQLFARLREAPRARRGRAPPGRGAARGRRSRPPRSGARRPRSPLHRVV